MSGAAGRGSRVRETPLPTGTVTFLLTDIEQSSRIWERDDATTVESAVARHYEILADAIARRDGARPTEQGEGDSVVGVFARASDAVLAALDAQTMLDTEDWPTSEALRVRMALHTGEAHLRDGGIYSGPQLNRCARLRELAHGGQVLISGATHDLVADNLPDDVTLKGLGSHRLRDLTRREQVWQLCHPKLVAEFPPLASLDSVPNNLPAQLTSFIGREGEIQTVGRLLADARLVTLTGAGGCGKTRLSLQVAAHVLDAYADGLWWVDLAPLADPSLVPQVVATTLGIRESPVEPITDTLVRRLSDRRLLILLDNCEHLVDACATLAARLLRGCAELSVVATSREPLGVEGEMTWRVPSLSLPEEQKPPLPSLERCESVRLFIDRAGRVRPNFALTENNASAVAEICRQLDGNALAIELAASRVRALTPQLIADGLSDRFQLLTGGTGGALPRQRTLEASVDWSHRLLEDDERTVFRRLSAFAGSFTLDAAEAVCAGDEIETQDVLDLISRLIDRSLVQFDDEEGRGGRYRLFETIRDYARHKLTDAGEVEDVRDRHLDFYVHVAQKAAPHLEGPDMLTWIDRVDLELDNLRIALDWSLRSSEPDQGLRLVGLLPEYWSSRGGFQIGRSRLEAPLARSGSDGVERALALMALARVAFLVSGDIPGARRHAEEAVAIGRRLNDVRVTGRALLLSGIVASLAEPDLSVASQLLEEAADAQRTAADHVYLSSTLTWIGNVHAGTTQSRRARAEYEEGLATARAPGGLTPRHLCLQFLAWLDLFEGRFGEAAAHLDECVALAHENGDRFSETAALYLIASVHTFRGRYEEAGEQCRRALTQALEDANPILVAIARMVVGVVLFAEAEVDGAGDELEQAFALLSVAYPRSAPVCRAHQARVALARGRVDDAGRYAEEALATARAIDEVLAVSPAMGVVAAIARLDGEPDRAEDLLHEALDDAAQSGHVPAVCDTLDGLAGAVADQDRFEEAARLLGAAQALHEKIGYVRFPVHTGPYEALVATVRDALGPDDFEQAWTEGTALSLEDALGYARRGRGERKRPPHGWNSLTPTELRVIELVAEGLTNPQITEKLFVSPRTVQSHLRSIFPKLGVSTRSELAVKATRRRP